ncbi:MAG: Mth938-like domain-containing protein [Mangrovicoccus sp.]
MPMQEVNYGDARPVEGYGPGFFRHAGEVFQGGLLLLPNLRQAWNGYGDRQNLLEAAGTIDVLILGTGAEIAHAPSEFRQELEAAGIGVEVMASPAACRTYNVLLGEGRRIGLAVLPV